MAEKRVIESDLSGRQDAARFTFGVGETWYEIDLTDEERHELEAKLKAYVEAGRKAQPKPVEKKKMVPDTTEDERKLIRDWGAAHGYEFRPRGRIPKELQAAYDKAHNITRTK